MQVIDGFHRLQAAKLRGADEIDVRYFDGDEASSFVLAVRINIMHGLPLTLADRKAAAARITGMFPQWSDRMIASVTGLSAKTVATVRDSLNAVHDSPNAENQQLDGRVGRDGRVRPVNQAERREITAGLLRNNPRASLREIARKAGVSPETVRQVRARLPRHPGPATPGKRLAGDDAGSAREAGPARQRTSGGRVLDEASSLQWLRADPAFRSTESGRLLLRLLATDQATQEHARELIESVPAHCLGTLAELAKARSRRWQEFTEDVAFRQREVFK
jgi:hypothetical protein